MNILQKLFDRKKPSNDFKDQFAKWLSEGLASPIPKEVKAFSFNLYQPAFEKNVKFSIELIGAERFDENDEDWACYEIWEPQQRSLSIPIKYSGVSWEECLDTMSNTIRELLETEMPFVKILNSRPIGIGFVDGNIKIIKT